MKIGILTLPIADNYGGILQTVALYRLLHHQGHEVVLIYKSIHEVLWKKIAMEILLKIPFHDFKNFKATRKMKKTRQIKKAFHANFIEEEIFTISKKLYSKKDLEKFATREKFDAVIVGSDQVWRKKYINDKYYKSYFLDFVDSSKTKKIAYAASFGNDYWEGEDDVAEISKLLKDFDAISTRESSGVSICQKSFNYNNAKHVLDPTLLMGKEFYKDEIISKYDISNIVRGGLLTYVLDEAEEKREVIHYVQDSLNIENLNHLNGFNSSEIIYSVPQWLASFAFAEFVVTDSFHGMVFSIIFEKNFIVIGNHNRGLDRFTSLLALLNLEDRLIFSLEDIKNKKIDDIDYNTVNKVLDENKKISLGLLVNALDDI